MAGPDDDALDLAGAVDAVLDGVRRPVLLVVDGGLRLPLAGPDDENEVVAVRPGDPKPEGRFPVVVVVAADADRLRTAARRAGSVGWARTVGVVVADRAAARTVRPHPAWPPLSEVEATAAWTRLTFAERLPAGPVLRALARAAAGDRRGARGEDGHGGLRVRPVGAAFDDAAARHPPDVVVDPPAPPVVAEATGRAPVVVAARDLVPPVDEAVFNPAGFRRDWTRPVVDLPGSTVLSPGLVRDLRDAQGVRLAPSHDQQDQRLAAGLAMSGVPLLGVPGGVLDGIAESSLDDPRGREEQSIRLRRAAHATHSVAAHRAALATRVGVRAAREPSVSVLLPVARPEQLAHAVAQVGRQRATDLELVLVAHGFTPDRGLVDDALRGSPGVSTSTIVTAATDSPPGARLALGTTAASGDVVLTLDPDARYGPDVVTDLLLARRHSGAEVVGAPIELLHVVRDDVTVRLDEPTEVVGTTVAAGCLLVGRALARSVIGSLGGCPAGPDPHAGLLTAVRAAGASVYRTHGLGWQPRTDGPAPSGVVARWPGAGPGALL